MCLQQRVADKETNVIEIHLEDLEEYFSQQSDSHFVERIKKNTKRYVNLFSEAADEHMPKAVREDNMEEEDLDLLEIFAKQRRENFAVIEGDEFEEEKAAGGGGAGSRNRLPAELERRY